MLGSIFSQPPVDLAELDHNHIEKGEADKKGKELYNAHKYETSSDWSRVRVILTHNDLET